MKRLIYQLKKNVAELSAGFIFLSLTLALFDAINLAAYALLLAMGLIFASIITYEAR